MKKELLVRIIMMIVGNILVGFGISLFRLSSFGTDPFTTMNLGISSVLDISFGTYQLLINILLVTLVLFLAKQYIGIGTIINMVGIGFLVDIFTNGYSLFFDDNLSLVTRLIILSVAFFIITGGFSLYMAANLGLAPYDGLAMVIMKLSKQRVPFSISRIMTDVTCVTIGFAFGAVVGIGTLITALLTGPVVEFFRNKVWEPIFLSNK